MRPVSYTHLDVYKRQDPAASGYIPERKWILRTDTGGFCKLEDNYKESGDDFYYSLSGNAELPSGTITIQELSLIHI